MRHIYLKKARAQERVKKGDFFLNDMPGQTDLPKIQSVDPYMIGLESQEIAFPIFQETKSPYKADAETILPG